MSQNVNPRWVEVSQKFEQPELRVRQMFTKVREVVQKQVRYSAYRISATYSQQPSDRRQLYQQPHRHVYQWKEYRVVEVTRQPLVEQPQVQVPTRPRWDMVQLRLQQGVERRLL